MAEWIYETGIGEARAALIEDGEIVEARIEVEGAGPRHGMIAAGRLIEITHPSRQGIVRLDGGAEAVVMPLPGAITLGASLLVEIVREAIGERGKPKRAKARPAIAGAVAKDGLTLFDRISASGLPVTSLLPHQADQLEQYGWAEVLEAAASGQFTFSGGNLRISLTPAMTLIDVDGHLAPFELACLGARQSAAAIRLFDLSGSIGIDLPTVGGKQERLAVAGAFDQAMPQPYERTAVNGFGFLQIIRPRSHASLCEILQLAPIPAAARALLRRVDRSGLVGATRITAHPKLCAFLECRPDWLCEIGQRLGGATGLYADPELAIGGGHVERA